MPRASDEYDDRGLGVRRELDASHLGRVLARRKLWILGPALLGLIASVVGVNLVRPRYTAEAKILLENQESFFTRPDRTDASAQVPLPDDEAVQSQVQLITSRDIARDAVRRLGLPGNPEFDPMAGGFGSVQRLLVLLGLARDPLSNSVEDRLLTAYYERLNVYPVAKSRVLSVQFTNNTTITSQQLSDLTSQLAQARNAEAESQAKAKLLRDMIRQNRIADVPDVANSDLIR